MPKCHQENNFKTRELGKVPCYRHKKTVEIVFHKNGNRCGDTDCPFSPSYVEKPVVEKPVQDQIITPS